MFSWKIACVLTKILKISPVKITSVLAVFISSGNFYLFFSVLRNIFFCDLLSPGKFLSVHECGIVSKISQSSRIFFLQPCRKRSLFCSFPYKSFESNAQWFVGGFHAVVQVAQSEHTRQQTTNNKQHVNMLKHVNMLTFSSYNIWLHKFTDLRLARG